MKTGPMTTKVSQNLTERVLPVVIVLGGALVGVVLHRNFGQIGTLDRLGIDERVARWPSEPFTPDLWKSAENQQRYRYYHDLVAKHGLLEMPIADVIALLGAPTVRVAEPQNGWDRLEYVITEPGLRQVPLALALQIDDATDTVVRFRVKTAHKSASKPAE